MLYAKNKLGHHSLRRDLLVESRSQSRQLKSFSTALSLLVSSCAEVSPPRGTWQSSHGPSSLRHSTTGKKSGVLVSWDFEHQLTLFPDPNDLRLLHVHFPFSFAIPLTTSSPSLNQGFLISGYHRAVIYERHIKQCSQISGASSSSETLSEQILGGIFSRVRAQS